MKYRRKGFIEALQWTGKNQTEVKAFAGQFAMFDYADTNQDGKTFDAVLKVKTSENILAAEIGDYIMRGEKGDFFIMKKNVFQSMYELA